MTTLGDTAGAVPAVRHQVQVRATLQRAFEVFTDGFGTWWPKSHTIMPVPVERAIIEPRAGGRCYDRGVDGSECDWGQVLAWEPPRRLVLAWQVDGQWRYEPDVEHASRVTVTFAPAGEDTVVELVHDEFERHRDGGASVAAGVRDGWGSALGLFTAAAQERPEPAVKYVMSYRSVEDFLPLARQHGPAHVQRLREFHARGVLLMVGTLDEPMNGDAMGIFSTREAAEEFIAGDPFVQHGVVESWAVRPWNEILQR